MLFRSIYLPLVEALDLPAAPDSAAPAPLARLRILVVDDEELVRDLVSEMLTAGGHAVITAADGSDAVDIYRQHWQALDLVILDMEIGRASCRERVFSSV